MDKNKKIKPTEGHIEQRQLAGPVEVRAVDGEGDSKEFVVRGLAAVYEKRSLPVGGWFDEIIERGALTKALEKSDVRAFFNHDWNHLLGREKSETLRLKETDDGLEFELSLPKSREDIRELVERGDLDECSFAFRVKGQKWEEERQEDGSVKVTRRITDIDFIRDITLATFGQYPDTYAEAKRCYQEYKEQAEVEERKFDAVAHKQRERFLFINKQKH